MKMTPGGGNAYARTASVKKASYGKMMTKKKGKKDKKKK